MGTAEVKKICEKNIYIYIFFVPLMAGEKFNQNTKNTFSSTDIKINRLFSQICQKHYSMRISGYIANSFATLFMSNVSVDLYELW